MLHGTTCGRWLDCLAQPWARGFRGWVKPCYNNFIADKLCIIYALEKRITWHNSQFLDVFNAFKNVKGWSDWHHFETIHTRTEALLDISTSTPNDSERPEQAPPGPCTDVFSFPGGQAACSPAKLQCFTEIYT